MELLLKGCGFASQCWWALSKPFTLAIAWLQITTNDRNPNQWIRVKLKIASQFVKIHLSLFDGPVIHKQMAESE